MSVTNVFFCDCGRQIGRPKDQALDKDDPPTYTVLPWHARLGDGRLHGIRCGTCRKNWLYLPADIGEFVEVEQCCILDRCECRYDDVAPVPEGRYCPRCMVQVNDPHFTQPYICDDCWTEADENE